MADQRDLHDIEQVVPAIFDADIRRWPRSPRWPVFEGAFRRDESPGQTVSAVNKFRSGSPWIWEDARAFPGRSFRT